MIDPRVRRGLLLATVLAALVGCFVAYGALEPDPDRHAYPGADELGAEPTVYLGERVSVAGPVVATDPVVIALEHEHGTDEFVVENAPPAEVGQELRAFATVEDGTTLYAHETLVRDSWELTYMYAVSALAALWVLVRALRHWRLDPKTLTVYPRTDGNHPRTDEGHPRAEGDQPRPEDDLPYTERDQISGGERGG